MDSLSRILRRGRLVPSLVALVLASPVNAQERPKASDEEKTSVPFATAGAPRDEASPEEPSRKPAPDSSTTEDPLPMPDDVPMKPSNKWHGPFQKRRLTLEGHLGFGTPVGAAGLMFEYSLLPQLSFAAGAGLGSGPRNRLHAAIAARARPVVTPGDHDTVVLEAAFSTGGYQRFEMGSVVVPADGPDPSPPMGPSATWAHFLQFEAAWEHRSDKGFLIRLGGGFATMLNPDALRCASSSSSSECAPIDPNSPELVAVLDFAVGQSF